MNFRNLRADEVYVRAQSVKQKGCILLLYKDSRCDMNILDETVTPMGWKREHTRDNHNCIVSIWDEDKEQWIGKEDTGVESFSEAQKGLAADSFKRACFNWGIGRELYTAPFIWVNLEKSETYKKGGNWRLKYNVKFSVDEMEIEDGQIVSLTIVDDNDNIRYNYSDGKSKYIDAPKNNKGNKSSPPAPSKKTITKTKLQVLKNRIKDVDNVTEEKVKTLFRVDGLQDLNDKQYKKAISKIDTTEESNKENQNENS